MIPTRLGLSDTGFLFCPEVIARGHEAAQALPTPRLFSPDSGGLLPKTQARQGPAPGLGGIPQLVQPAHLDGGPTTGTAAAGAVLPRLRRAVSARRSQAPHQSHGGGPHRAPPRQLGQVHRPGQPPESVQAPSRPENGPGTGRGTARKVARLTRIPAGKLRLRLGARAGAEAHAQGKACGFLHMTRPKESFANGGVRPYAPSVARKCPRSGNRGCWGRMKYRFQRPGGGRDAAADRAGAGCE